MLPPYVAVCCDTLRGAGYQVYPVGGCVRDFLLGRVPGDWDVATDARPEAVMALFRRTVPTGLAHGTVTVLLGGASVEVTTFRREAGYSDRRRPDAVSFDVSLTEDLSRRDFTVNAMALDGDGTVIDPFGGREDLARGIIRCVGDPAARFSEDALRMFRAVRFAVQLGFAIEPRTAAALAACGPLVNGLAGERVRIEVEKTILSPNFAPLAHLPATPLARWAGFCALLGGPPREIIMPLKPTAALRRALIAGYEALRAGAPDSPADWRRTLARYGPLGALAAACMCNRHDALFAVLKTNPPVRVTQLAVSGGELLDLGYGDQRVGEAQRRMLDAVLEDPARNTRAALLSLLCAEYPV